MRHLPRPLKLCSTLLAGLTPLGILYVSSVRLPSTDQVDPASGRCTKADLEPGFCPLRIMSGEPPLRSTVRCRQENYRQKYRKKFLLARLATSDTEVTPRKINDLVKRPLSIDNGL